jgi:iron(III) transport system ATP-binding protein
MNHEADQNQDELLVLTGIAKSYTKTPVIQDFNIRVKYGEFIGLMGPSGCGKSTLLRLIAGLDRPDRGEIRLAGDLISSAEYHLAPERRRMGMVFQNLALWPHLTVMEHLEYGISNLKKAEQHARAEKMLEFLRLTEKGRRFPDQLSGGERQRVALGRALIVKPHILLCDEPLNSLDRDLRDEVRQFFYQIIRKERITTIFVSHDPEDLSGADRVIHFKRV